MSIELFIKKMSKICTLCNLEKDTDKFPKRGGFRCKECMNERQRNYMKKYYEENKEDIKNKEKERVEKKKENIDENMNKICIYCDIEKNNSDFRINRNRCKDCEKKYGRNYNKENKEIRDKWITENRERVKKLQREWMADKRNKDPEFKLISNIRRRVLSFIKNKKYQTNKYLGTDNTNLKNWLETCFDENMNWENYGKYWHIDHVIPIYHFDKTKEEEVLFCMNWKNVSPLSKTENLSKNKNLNLIQIKNHIEKLNIFTNNNEIQYIEQFNKYINNINCETP